MSIAGNILASRIESIRDYALDVYFPRIYNRHAKKSIDPYKVLFIETKLAEMPDAFGHMWNYLAEKTNLELEYFSLKQIEVGYAEYFKNCRQLMKKLASAHYVFLSDSSDIISCVDLRKETIVCQLWHACGAFKKWGVSTVDQLFGASSERMAKHPFNKNLSIVTVSSPEVEWAYREAMDLESTPEAVQALGVSRTDVFFSSEFLENARVWVNEQIPYLDGRRIILYAPTFRGMPAMPEVPDRLDIQAMNKTLAGEYVLIIKHHPFVKDPPFIPEDSEDFAYMLNDAPIDKLLAVSDVCITDYSSVVFEYSLFERPILFFAYDIDEYLDWRGFYYDYKEFVPGPIVGSTDAIIDYIQHVDERFNKQQVADFRQKFMSSCDGHATERIYNAVINEAVKVNEFAANR